METQLLLTQLEFEFSTMSTYAAQMGRSDFFRRENAEAWSPCEHLQHLTLTLLPVTNLLKQPAAFAERWGHSGRASRSQADFWADYKAATTGTGWKTLPAFVPKTTTGAEENAVLHSAANEKVGADFYALTGSQFPGLPDKLPTADKTTQEEVVAVLMGQCKALITLIGNYDEAQLDDLQLPFPYIGLVTLREMLMLTLNHFAHHQTVIANMVLANE